MELMRHFKGTIMNFEIFNSACIFVWFLVNLHYKEILKIDFSPLLKLSFSIFFHINEFF